MYQKFDLEQPPDGGSQRELSMAPAVSLQASSPHFDGTELLENSTAFSSAPFAPLDLPPLPPPMAPHHNVNVSSKDPPSDPKEALPKKRPFGLRFTGCMLVALVLVIVAVVLSVVLSNRNPATSKPQPPSNGPTPPLVKAVSTLDAILERGSLQCGVTDQIGLSALNEGKREGFEIDLCRAIGAAIFGNDTHVEMIPLSNSERFGSLRSGQVDVLSAGATYTMERDLFEPLTGAGFTFSTPYLYNGLGFAGKPEFVACAESLNTTRNCSGVQICLFNGTTHVEIVQGLLPNAGIVIAPTTQGLYLSFAQGQCNVLAGEQFDLPEILVRQAGYTGNYTVGQNQFSKEPLALVTRDEDVQWSDFVNWVVLALLTAEDQHVTQSVAASIAMNPTTLTDETQLKFIYSVATVGNYAEIYERHLESIVPRAAVNTLNNGSSPLIYSFPFGDTSGDGPGPTPNGTLEKIVQRGFLRCGISANTFFATFNYTTQQWRGLDSDFCRAISAALFGIDNTIFVPVTAEERFLRLANGDIDLLSRETSATYQRDIMEPTTMQGFSFSSGVFRTGTQFGGIPPYNECAERRDVTSSTCKNLRICVDNGTTTIDRVRELFLERFIVAKSTEEQVGRCLETKEANVIAGHAFDTSIATIRQYYSGSYEEGSTLFSRESLALVTREDDRQWTSFVNWIVTATFYAEEQGISQSTFERMPLVNLFGTSYESMFQNAIRAVGSYGEMYKRSAESKYPRSVLNKLNTAPFGPEHYPLPGLQF